MSHAKDQSTLSEIEYALEALSNVVALLDARPVAADDARRKDATRVMVLTLRCCQQWCQLVRSGLQLLATHDQAGAKGAES